MRLQPLIDWFTRRKRRERLNLYLSAADGSIVIRQGWRRVRLSHSDALLLMQLKGMQG